MRNRELCTKDDLSIWKVDNSNELHYGLVIKDQIKKNVKFFSLTR